jgi:hypothetical protein
MLSAAFGLNNYLPTTGYERTPSFLFLLFASVEEGKKEVSRPPVAPHGSAGGSPAPVRLRGSGEPLPTPARPLPTPCGRTS